MRVFLLLAIVVGLLLALWLSEGPNYAGTGASDNGVGTVAWNNTANIVSNNDIVAGTGFFTNATTQYLKATNFGFAIPAGATIDGIVVEVGKAGSNGGGERTVFDSRARIVKGGTIGSTDRSSLISWTIGESTVTYGSSSDLWGETWTADDINSSTFGFVLSAFSAGTNTNCEVDFVRITVHYTEAAPPAGTATFNASWVRYLCPVGGGVI